MIDDDSEVVWLLDDDSEVSLLEVDDNSEVSLPDDDSEASLPDELLFGIGRALLGILQQLDQGYYREAVTV